MYVSKLPFHLMDRSLLTAISKIPRFICFKGVKKDSLIDEVTIAVKMFLVFKYWKNIQKSSLMKCKIAVVENNGF